MVMFSCRACTSSYSVTIQSCSYMLSPQPCCCVKNQVKKAIGSVGAAALAELYHVQRDDIGSPPAAERCSKRPQSAGKPGPQDDRGYGGGEECTGREAGSVRTWQPLCS